ncbi:MAG: FadR family transcriptional regulator [Spirochaetales bacterium]|nr:FadR family transcriptional regulator [Spirochaetales bacterium]
MNSQRKKSELTALRIEKTILQGIYKPGDRLPPERVLAEEFCVSRSILREAMKHIASLGLVRTEPQSGTYVTDYGKEASLELLIYLMDNNETLDPIILKALLDFRELLEVGAAERAALRSSEDFLAVLRLHRRNMEDGTTDPLQLAKKDYEFHTLIIDRTDNIAFRLLFNACRSVYLFYAREFYRVPGHLEHALSQWDRLLEAFKQTDSAAAGAIMKETLAYGRDSIYQSLDFS